MTASFIGLLMLGSIRPSEAEAEEANASVPVDDESEGMPLDSATPPLSGAMAATMSSVPAIAHGSVFVRW